MHAFAIREDRQVEALALLAAIVDSSDDAIISTDLDGIVTSWNKGAEQIFNYAADEMIGKSVGLLILPERSDDESTVLDRVRHGERIDHYETFRRRKDGSTVEISLTVSPIRNRQGAIVGASWIARDITERREAEEQLRRTGTDLRRSAFILNHAGWAVATIDSATNHIEFCNAAFARMHGCSAEELKGTPFVETFAPEWRPNWPAHLNNVSRAPDYIYESLHVRKDGTVFPVRTRATTFKDEHGNPLFRASMFEDITEQRRAAEQLHHTVQRLQLLSDAARALLQTDNPVDLLDRIFDGLAATFDLDFYFHFTADPLNRCLQLRASRGVPPEVARQIQFLQFGNSVCGRVAETLTPMVVTHVQDSPDPETQFIRRLGISAYVCHPMIANGRLLGTLSFGSRRQEVFTPAFVDSIRALTDMAATAVARKEAEEALAEAHRELEEYTHNLEATVAERTAHLRTTIAELEAFSYSLAHDMRAPLRTIQSFSQIALAEAGDKLGELEIDLLNRVVVAASRLDRLIRDVLAYTRLSRESLEIRTIDVEQVVRQIIAERTDLQPPRVSIHIDTPLHPVRGHEGSLSQCISNLLSNAVKFVAPGTVPEVRIRSEQSGGQVRLWFEDNGIGIPKAAQERIFGIFQRVHSEDIYPGTGIGLAIVRKAVERMNGEVGVESRSAHGSRFWVQLPAG